MSNRKTSGDKRNEPRSLLRRDRIQALQREGGHPWNDNSQRLTTDLARSVGMSRAMVSKVTLPPGKDSFVYHSHQMEEEWVYILAGTGTALVDGDHVVLGAGDFLGFAAPSVAHNLTNTGTEPLTYLMGGECCDVDLADFPDLGKRKIKIGHQVQVFDLETEAGNVSGDDG